MDSKLGDIRGALASVATDKVRASIVDSLPSGDNVIGRTKIGDSSNVALVTPTEALSVIPHLRLIRAYDINTTYNRTYMYGYSYTMDTGDIDLSVTETSYTEKWRLFPSWDFPFWDCTAIAVWPYIRGYIDTSGETMYVRIVGAITGHVYASRSYTSTTNEWKGFGEFWVDPRDLYCGSGLRVEAYVTGGTGHITEIRFYLRTHVPPTLLVGHDQDNYRPRPVRVTSDGKVVCYLG